MAVTSFVAKLKWVASNWRRIGVDFAGNVGGDPGSGSGQRAKGVGRRLHGRQGGERR